MSRAFVNLSARPFVNRRPVMRLSLLLWAAGLLLLAGNLWLYWDFLVGRGDVDARRRQAGEAITVEQQRIEALSSELASYDLAAQNEQVRYLNQRIEQRRFSWSRLFDDLAGLLPRDVRLVSLTPTSGEEGATRRSRFSSRTGGSALSDGRVPLKIEARARNDESILALVDSLFADPDFERPNLLQQTQERGGPIRFDLEVLYRPSAPEEPELLPLEPEAEHVPETAEDPEDGGKDRPRPTALGRAASEPRELA